MRFSFFIFLLATYLNAGIIINEIMYNPPGEDNVEWLELYNTTSNALSLDGWELKKGIKFTFSAEHIISATGFIVIARDAAAFTSAYPHVICSGEFKGKLSNKGEKIILKNAFGDIVDEVVYDVNDVWPQAAFNGGASLERISTSVPADSPCDWQPSHNNQAWYLVEKTLKIYRPQLKIKLLEPDSFSIDDIKICEVATNENLFPQGNIENSIKMQHSSSCIVKPTSKSHSGKTALNLQANRRGGKLKIFLPNVFDKRSRYLISFYIKPESKFDTFKLLVPGNRQQMINLNYERKFGGTPGEKNTNPKRKIKFEILSLQHLPFFPQPGVAVNVNAHINGAGTNSSIKIYYKKGLTGSFASVEMTVSASNLYAAVLPPLGKNEYYDYYICVSNKDDFCRYPSQFDFPNFKRCYCLEIKNKPAVPLVAFWLKEKKPGRRYAVLRSRYMLCDVAISNKIYHNAKVRYRGAHSYRNGIKKSYNLKFCRGMRPSLFEKNEYENGVVLNAMAFDYSFLREKLSLELFRREGIPASRNYYVRSYKNGYLRGLFLFMERINGDFLEKNNLNKTGTIISPEKRHGLNPKACKVVYESEQTDGIALLQKLYNDLHPLARREVTALENRKKKLLADFDYKQLINFTAVNVIVQKRDGIVANFYAYCDAVSNKWQIIPWDHDFTWGLAINGFHPDDRAIPPFYGSRAHRQAVCRSISLINDTLFWPEKDFGAEVTANIRNEFLNTLTNIITSQLTSGSLEEFVNNVASGLQYEAKLEIEMRLHRPDSEYIFDSSISNLKRFMKFRETYLFDECERLR